MDIIAKFLLDAEITFQTEVSLASFSMMRAGGVCSYFVTPNSIDKLQILLAFLKSKGVPFRVVGKLSNVLFRDGLIKTIIISTCKLRNHGFNADGEYRTESGASVPEMAHQLSQAGYVGFSGLVGLPASIGGAVYMNADCYGNAISDFLVRVKCCNELGDIVEFKKDVLDFSWRHSVFQQDCNGCVILEAFFAPERGDITQIQVHMSESTVNRQTFQDHRYPNLGSIFATRDIYRAIGNRFAFYNLGYWLTRFWVKFHKRDRAILWARLINQYTQRYFKIGDTDQVGFSEYTFNCIVNKGGANASELISFIHHVEESIESCVPLEIEIFEDIA